MKTLEQLDPLCKVSREPIVLGVLLEALAQAYIALGSCEHSLRIVAETGVPESGHTHACRARASIAADAMAKIDRSVEFFEHQVTGLFV